MAPTAFQCEDLLSAASIDKDKTLDELLERWCDSFDSVNKVTNDVDLLPGKPSAVDIMNPYAELLDHKAQRAARTFQAVEVAVSAVFRDQLSSWAECKEERLDPLENMVRLHEYNRIIQCNHGIDNNLINRHAYSF